MEYKHGIKICVTTSPGYEHLVKIFAYLFNKNFGSFINIDLVGYEYPDFKLPDNFTFHSLGKHSGNKKDFSNDLRRYFTMQPQWIMWFMEDSWVKEVNFDTLSFVADLTEYTSVGRINLSNETMKQDHHFKYDINGVHIYENNQDAKYRLSTQPSIWNRDFLLQYLKPDLSPWDFESQHPVNDGWRILGPENPVVYHNEGVRRFDLYKYDLNGIKEEQIEEMKKLGLI